MSCLSFSHCNKIQVLHLRNKDIEPQPAKTDLITQKTTPKHIENNCGTSAIYGVLPIKNCYFKSRCFMQSRINQLHELEITSVHHRDNHCAIGRKKSSAMPWDHNNKNTDES